MIRGLEGRDGTSTTTVVYEGVPGTSGAAGPGTEVADSGSCQTPDHVRQKTQKLGGASPARPARHARESRRPVTELEAELSRLKRDLAEARMERDILEKATAYFAKAQLPDTRS